MVLVTLDNCGIHADHTAQLARRLEAKAGVPRDRVALTATHTHSAPMLRGVLPNIFGQPLPPEDLAHIDRYTDELLDKLEQVALDALADRRPAQLSWGVGSSTISINRRDPQGPVDRDLPVLVVRDPGGPIRAVYMSYACHCVALRQNKISGDWAGYAQEWIEKAHPGATALVSVGCGGRLQSAHRRDDRQHGRRVGTGGRSSARSIACWAGSWRRSSARSPPSCACRAGLGSGHEAGAGRNRHQARRSVRLQRAVQLAALARGELTTKIDYPIGAWRFGDSLAMVFLAGEVVTDYSLRLKRELDGRRLWINAYANDVPCYIPSEAVLKAGGYEAKDAMIYYSLPGPLRAGLEQKIVDATVGAVGPAFAAPFDATRTQGSLPLSPQQSVAAIRVPDGMVAELMVAEPLVIDPVAIQWGPDGRLWVVEMHDYPEGVQRDFQPGGRIRLLEDTDDDGRYDKSTVFLDGIPFPTGVTPWPAA